MVTKLPAMEQEVLSRVSQEARNYRDERQVLPILTSSGAGKAFVIDDKVLIPNDPAESTVRCQASVKAGDILCSNEVLNQTSGEPVVEAV